MSFYPNLQNAPQGMDTMLGDQATNMISNIGFGYLQSTVGDNINKLNSNQSLSILKYYFHINNSYVRDKIRLLIFPFRQSQWKRQIIQQEGIQHYMPPSGDLHAPDLYIPLMAFITYVLVFSFITAIKGASASFNPEVFATIASSGIFMWFLEVCYLKGGLYLLTNGPTAPMLDAIAYSGYKYVGVVLTLLLGNLGNYVYYGVAFLASFAMAFFMLRTLRQNAFFGPPAAATKYFLLSVSLLQMPIFFYLSYFK